MYKLILILSFVLCCSCVFASGYIPQHRRMDSGVGIIHLRDSSFEDRSHVYVVEKIVNDTPYHKEVDLICGFTAPDIIKSIDITRVLMLRPYEWKEVYFSAPIRSRFRINFRCKIGLP